MEMTGFVFGMMGFMFGMIACATANSAMTQIKKLSVELADLRRELHALDDGSAES